MESYVVLGLLMVVLASAFLYVYVNFLNIQTELSLANAELKRYETIIEISRDIGIPINNVFCVNHQVWAEWHNSTYGELLLVQKINNKWQIVDIYYFYGDGPVYKSETNQSKRVTSISEWKTFSKILSTKGGE
jgi:hypothetical protein